MQCTCNKEVLLPYDLVLVRFLIRNTHTHTSSNLTSEFPRCRAMVGSQLRYCLCLKLVVVDWCYNKVAAHFRLVRSCKSWVLSAVPLARTARWNARTQGTTVCSSAFSFSSDGPLTHKTGSYKRSTKKKTPLPKKRSLTTSI